MSAYLCDQDTINAIATFAADHKLVADAKLFADLLTLQNVASMRARYPGREWLKADVIDVAATYRYERVEVSAARIVNAADEYDYQACETADYQSTLCSRLIDRVHQRAVTIAELERKGGCGAARLAIIWTVKSANKKTGPMPVSTTSKETCPSVCPFKGNGCYAETGPLGSLWSKMTETGPHGVFQSGVAKVRTTDWKGLCANVAALMAGTVWRHNQAGDLPHKGGRIDAGKLRALVRANRGRRGFTYTHHNVLHSAENRALVAGAVAAGFTINLSGNNLGHADQLAALGIAPVVVVLPEGAERLGATPAGRRVVVCPATYRDDVSCITCQLCARARDVIVGFPAHGARRRRAGEVAEERL